MVMNIYGGISFHITADKQKQSQFFFSFTERVAWFTQGLRTCCKRHAKPFWFAQVWFSLNFKQNFKFEDPDSFPMLHWCEILSTDIGDWILSICQQQKHLPILALLMLDSLWFSLPCFLGPCFFNKLSHACCESCPGKVWLSCWQV